MRRDPTVTGARIHCCTLSLESGVEIQQPGGNEEHPQLTADRPEKNAKPQATESRKYE